MNESTVKTNLNLAFREARDFARSTLVTCHTDRFLSGWPDVSVIDDGCPHYVEVKYWRKGVRFEKLSKRIQIETCRRIYDASRGRCHYVIFDARNTRALQTWILIPDQMLKGATTAMRLFEGFDYAGAANYILSL